MKKKNIFALIAVVFVLVVVVISFVGLDGSSQKLSDDPDVILENAKKESEAATDDKMKSFTEIDIDKFIELYNDDNKSIVVIGRSGCQYCKIAEPILKTIMYEKKIDIYYLSTDGLGAEGNKKLYDLNNDYFEQFATPWLMIVSNGDIVDSIKGLTDKSHYIDFFKKYEFIK